ncbi:cyclic AMP response element-binding protein A-like isoform X2 [Bacillus rossius redtenbacheri]|uniref:cyclic AMP response element-binding protein A-like isoform X2 n=1 Tax=Bacillus rossius redtenbacheri TaxID=93214 RepID=UPI002FDDAEC8
MSSVFDPLLGQLRCGLYDSDESWPLSGAPAASPGGWPHVVIHDRLMSDAAVATAPIKTEHSYSYPMPDSPCSLAGRPDSDEEDDDNMDGGSPRASDPGDDRSLDGARMAVVKDEPISDTESGDDSCCASSGSPPSPAGFTCLPLASRLEQHSVLKKSAGLLDSRAPLLSKLEVKVEPATAGFPLPPTPPSSACSDTEGVSPDADTRQRHCRRQGARVYLSAGRQPIQSPLISTQMKGLSGTLVLTDEEKRTLVAEGYPIPTRLPLSKAEEKALKKIRRKIKNKISAQESRRKKKEYMDCLEKKVEVLTNENFDFKKKIELLEDSNAAMLRELKKLQAIVSRDLLGSGSCALNVPQYIGAKSEFSSRPSRS